jgi:hypothetical protein
MKKIKPGFDAILPKPGTVYYSDYALNWTISELF